MIFKLFEWKLINYTKGPPQTLPLSYREKRERVKPLDRNPVHFMFIGTYPSFTRASLNNCQLCETN